MSESTLEHRKNKKPEMSEENEENYFDDNDTDNFSPELENNDLPGETLHNPPEVLPDDFDYGDIE